MNRYRIVGGVTEVGPGQVVQLDKAQFELRQHRVDLLKKDDKAGVYTIRTRDVMQFKVGEVIGLPDLPKNMVDSVEPLAVISNVDKMAKEKAGSRRKAEADAKAKADAEAKARASTRA